MAHIATILQMNAAITPDNRNVLDVNTNHGRDNAQGGRGQGRGGRSGYGGRGRKRGRNIYLGTYSPAQWHALSAENKKNITAKGRKWSAEQSQLSASGMQISKVLTNQQQDQDAQSAVTMGTATVNNQQRVDSESAGSAMTGDD